MNNNRSIVFIVRDDFITFRRYAGIAAHLMGFNVRSVFIYTEKNKSYFNSTSIKENIISDNIKHIHFDNYLVGYLKSIYFKIFKKYLIYLFGKIKLKTSIIQHKYFLDRYSDDIRATNNIFKQDIVSLVDNVGLDIHGVVFDDVKITADKFIKECKKASFILDKLKPSAIIFDLEYHFKTAAILSVSKKQLIPLFSLQHGLGDCIQYLEIPKIADYYFAYSNYNIKVLKTANVKCNIISTWDFKKKYVFPSPVDSKERERTKYELKINDKSVFLLVTLRSEVAEEFNEFRHYNRILIEKLFVLLEHEDVKIVLRPHPNDNCKNISEIKSIRHIVSKMKNKFIFSTMSVNINKYLLASNLFITFESSTIVEAMQVGVPSIVINLDEGASWPEWSKYNSFLHFEIEEFMGMQQYDFNLLLNDATNIMVKNRENFLMEFFVHDSFDHMGYVASRLYKTLFNNHLVK